MADTASTREELEAQVARLTEHRDMLVKFANVDENAKDFVKYVCDAEEPFHAKYNDNNENPFHKNPLGPGGGCGCTIS